MSQSKRTVLVTGCSDGGMGAALAAELHNSGLHVIATARKLSAMSSLASVKGIELLTLDITSDESIKECVEKVTKLDILINNAGATYVMPVSDVAITEAKKLFEINVWGQIAVTQAFLPLLLKSTNGMIVNHTSVGAALIIPFQAVYNASKAAMSTFTQTLRLEMEPFNIKVIELKTGGVKTNIIENTRSKGTPLPKNSIYDPARAEAESLNRSEWAEGQLNMTPERWAKNVTADLLRPTPPPIIWRGDAVWSAWFAGIAPFGWLDGITKKMTGLSKIGEIIKKKT